MNLAALAISDMSVIKKIYEVLPSNLQEQIKKAYPSYFGETFRKCFNGLFLFI